jgi:ornithine cyclodeaminase
MNRASQFPFGVLSAAPIRRLIEADLDGCVQVIQSAYLSHDAGRTVNPHSSFLTFPDAPKSRIIALPAHLGAPWNISGIKWIASYPDNVGRGFPRASAVIVLNGSDHGYPYACLEGSVISAARTAASAALAAVQLRRGQRKLGALGIVGTGLIAAWVCRFLFGTGWECDELHVYDLDPRAARRFVANLPASSRAARVRYVADVGALLRACELTVFATVAAKPHVHDVDMFAHAPSILHLSLRDLAPAILLGAQNFVDDVAHVLRAQTSLHLAEQERGHADFITGTLGDLLQGRRSVDPERPAIFSPFGLGLLDLALSKYVYERALASEPPVMIDGFFAGAD